jgi:hypothetical protein
MPMGRGRVVTSGEGEEVRKECRRMILCTNECKLKNEIKTVSQMGGGGGIKENGEGGKFNYICYVVRISINATMHPQSGQQFFVYKYIFVYIYKK